MEATILFQVLLLSLGCHDGDKSFEEFTVASFIFSGDVFVEKRFLVHFGTQMSEAQKKTIKETSFLRLTVRMFTYVYLCLTIVKNWIIISQPYGFFMGQLTDSLLGD